MGLAEDRAGYETAVRALRADAERLLEEGTSPERVAREMVRRRNELKREYRHGLPPELLLVIEQRNLARYGDPLGPGADALLHRYDSWESVIDAACRPLDLSGSLAGGRLRE